MEKLITIKSLSRTKATLIFGSILILLSVPTLFKVFNGPNLFLALSVISILLAAILKRLRRINYKISLLSK